MKKEESLPNVRSMVKFLQQEGWKISTAGAYKHRKQGKLNAQKDGSYKVADILRYAKTWLPRTSTGKKESARIEELQRKKARLEVEKISEDIARLKFSREKEEGKWINRALLEIELASRAAVFDAGLGHLFQSQAGLWIDLVSGNPKTIQDFIRVLMAEKDKLLNEYAQVREFSVEFVD